MTSGEIQKQIEGKREEIKQLEKELGLQLCKEGKHQLRYSQGGSPSESDWTCQRAGCGYWESA